MSDPRLLLICRSCAVKHSEIGNRMTSSIEIDSETFGEIDSISLVRECPDCWDPILKGKP